MARQARTKSESGIFHIMMRGVNKQRIFLDKQDYKKFIQILIDCKRISKFELYAYCLMPNHIHLLIKENDEDISKIMKRIGCRFVYWYNAKYQRVGHLFQDRFRSEPIETDDYFLCALRYIHQNPVKGKLVENCAEYPYSSYQWYYENGVLVDKEKALSMISIKQFGEYHEKTEKKSFIELTESKKIITDENAEEIYDALMNAENIHDISILNKDDKKAIIKKLKEKGLSIRQVTTLTGLTKRQVEKA